MSAEAPISIVVKMIRPPEDGIPSNTGFNLEVSSSAHSAGGVLDKVVATPGDMQENALAEQVCRHHWLIDTPNGPTSRGCCKHCGATSEFQNAMDDHRIGIVTDLNESPRVDITRYGLGRIAPME